MLDRSGPRVMSYEVIVALSLFLSGCTTSTTLENSINSKETSQPHFETSTSTINKFASTVPEPTNPVIPPIPEILDFKATLSDGSHFIGRDLAGANVLFWFWAPN